MEERIKRVTSPSSSSVARWKIAVDAKSLGSICGKKREIKIFSLVNDSHHGWMIERLFLRGILTRLDPSLPLPSSMENGISFRFALPAFRFNSIEKRNFPGFDLPRNEIIPLLLPSCAAAGPLMLRDRQRSFGLIVYPKARPASVPFL